MADPKGRIDWPPGVSTRRSARSNSGANFVTRARIETPALLSITFQCPEMTCSFVTTTPGATKKPVPLPAGLSIDTMAGMAAPMTSSSGGGAPPNAGRLELTLGTRTSGIGATGGCSVGTVAGANRSGAAAAFASEVSSDTALEEAPGRVVSDDDHWTASMASKAMLIPLQIRAQGTGWRGGLTSAAWAAASGDSSSASASYPQRHRTTLFGTRRLHAGQTHTNEPPVIFGDMPTCARTAH